MKQQRKEFIIQAHAAACSDWKTKIETEFPKMFKKDKLAVGKWYKYDEKAFKALMVWGNSEYTYGFWNGEYKDNLCFRDAFNKIPATDKEVSEALIAEAKRRGYKNGNYECMAVRNTLFVKDNFFFESSTGQLWMGIDGYANQVFANGVWAEIIEEEKPVYEWQYVYNSTWYRNKTTLCHYTSKKEFILTNQGSKPLHKVKESKRIRK
jgi:hypothetical protein